MSAISAIYPLRGALTEVVEFPVLATAGGTTVDMTINYGKVVASIARTATGKFTVTFSNNELGVLISCRGMVHNASGTAPLIVMCPLMAYTANVTGTTSTCAIEIYNMSSGSFGGSDSAAAALAIPAANALVELNFRFLRTTI